MAKIVTPKHGRGKMNRVEKGDPPLNPKGRPPKTLTKITQQLKEAGYERVTPSGIAEAYEIILGMDQAKLESMVKSKTTPMIIRVVGKAFLSKQGLNAVEILLNRAQGRPIQKELDVTPQVEFDLTAGIKKKIAVYDNPPTSPRVRKVDKKPTVDKGAKQKSGTKIVRLRKPKT